jgi:uncharacterized membrane protein
MKPVSAFRSEPSSEGPPGATNLSRGLGWFSIALGVTELAAPRVLAKAIGIDPRGGTARMLRAMGAREIAAGLAVLLRPERPLPLWSRVAGDAIDLALLGYAASQKRASGPRIVGAIAAVAGVAALDVFAGRRTQRAYARADRPVIFAVTINKPPEEVYAFYRKLSQLPLFMDYLESVTETGAKTSRWVARLPVAGTVAWDAEITEDRPGELIAWQSVPGSPIETRGRVTFARPPGRNMTEVRIELQLGVLGTRPSTALARWFARPQVKGDLRRLKQVIETGEVLHSDASVHRGPHPAQPPGPSERVAIDPAAMPFFPNPPTAQKGVTR